MRVTTPSNLIFDDSDPRCFLKLETGQHGKHYAFVQCVDGDTGEKSPTGGIWCHQEQEAAMAEILNGGGISLNQV